MNKAELIAALKAKGFVALVVDEEATNANLEAALDALNASDKAAELSAKVTELQAVVDYASEVKDQTEELSAQVKDLELIVAEKNEAIAELTNQLTEINEALAKAEASKVTVGADNIVEIDGEKFSVNSGVTCVLEGESIQLSKEELINHEGALQYLKGIESGVLTKIEG
jgi:chromosome segregation ATPase